MKGLSGGMDRRCGAPSRSLVFVVGSFESIKMAKYDVSEVPNIRDEFGAVSSEAELHVHG
jgi:hypothetical protein